MSCNIMLFIPTVLYCVILLKYNRILLTIISIVIQYFINIFNTVKFGLFVKEVLVLK